MAAKCKKYMLTEYSISKPVEQNMCCSLYRERVDSHICSTVELYLFAGEGKIVTLGDVSTPLKQPKNPELVPVLYCKYLNEQI